MADPISDVMSEIFGLLEEIEDIGPIAQIGFSLGLTLFALLFTRYFLLRMAWRVVKRTQAEWDNEILDPIANRLYIFILLAGVELSMMWTLGRNDEVYSAVAPYFSGIYIILSASIISVAIKFIVPSAMEKYNSNKSVTVTCLLYTSDAADE